MTPSALPAFIAAVTEPNFVLLRPLLGSVSIAALVFLGTALRERYKTQLGSPDSSNADSHDGCPRCGTPNPASRDHCEYCRAGLPDTRTTA